MKKVIKIFGFCLIVSLVVLALEIIAIQLFIHDDQDAIVLLNGQSEITATDKGILIKQWCGLKNIGNGNVYSNFEIIQKETTAIHTVFWKVPCASKSVQVKFEKPASGATKICEMDYSFNKRDSLTYQYQTMVSDAVKEGANYVQLVAEIHSIDSQTSGWGIGIGRLKGGAK